MKFLPLVMLAMFLVSCSQQSKRTEDQYINDAKTKLDEKKFDEAVADYRELLKNYPKSDKAIFAYNQIAGIQIENLKNYEGAISTYKELAAAFPDKKEAKQALFMVAFIYDETLKDKENAKASYKSFLEKYPTDTDPNDKMSESAKTMLQVLESGKSIEDMIQQKINEMGGQKSDSVNLDIKDEPSGTPEGAPKTQAGNKSESKSGTSDPAQGKAEEKKTDSPIPGEVQNKK